MAVLKPFKGDYYFWKYLPSQVASITFIVLFLVIFVLHSWRICKNRSWFCIWFAIGCLCSNPLTGEVVGYASREAAYNQTDSIVIYILQATFTVIAPAFYAASIYMTLGRIIRCVKGEHLSIIRIDRLTKTFVWGDVLSLSVQGGASNLTSHANTAKIGNDIVVAGLFIQIVLLGVFFATSISFQRRLSKQPTNESKTTDIPWRQTLYMIYTVSILIFARSIFRVVEFIQGQDGYSLGHEWTLYVFDTVPMFIVAVIFWWWYPGSIFHPKAVEDLETVELSHHRAKSGGSLETV
ncbi:related to Rtm1p [Phialocephala subalpina]|uniref:Related to Rtm1p n=1 Tax=Phialocephala subalpina TaxID=576137 RepID=A0A1L7WLQ9_9HELO|nr:related to Rtm1p [Phialocephala subalpina]